MEIIIFAGVVIIVGGLAFLAGQGLRKQSSQDNQLKADLQRLQQEKIDLNARYEGVLAKCASFQGINETLNKQIAGLEQEKLRQQNDIQQLQESLATAKIERATFETEKKNLAEEKEKFNAEKEQILANHKSQFESLATDIFNKQTLLFKQSNKEELGHMLAPMKEQFEEQLRDFKAKIDVYAKDQREDKTNLNSKIQHIEQLTRDFVSSITYQSQARGLWGEESLRQLLENSGLQKDLTYFEQISQEDKRPDFIVRLPNNKMIVIDAKTVFKHYDAYVHATDENTKKVELKAHIDSLFDTVKTLGNKAYQRSIDKICKKLNIEESGDPVEMVLMYVQPEGALSCALAADSSLLDYAKERNVILVGQSTLMGALQIVDALWLNFRDDEKNKEIRTAAEKFITAFGNFLAAWVKVGKRIEEALAAHQDTIEIVGEDTGKGLVKYAQDLANLQPHKINEKTAQSIIKAGYDFTGERK